MMAYSEFYDRVYSRDNPKNDPYGWIQWKGTNVCMDIHCLCGYFGHVDQEFFYFYECPECHRKFAVGQNIKLIELDSEEVSHRETEAARYQLNAFYSDKEHHRLGA